MPEVIDWQKVPVSEQALRAAVAALEAGRLVVLPTEAGYVLGVAGRPAEARAKLHEVLPDAGLTPVGLSCETVVRDWVPRFGPIGRRLTRRLWPGPVILALPDSARVSLPESVGDATDPSGVVHVCCPAHEVAREVLRMLPGPVVLADAAHLVPAESATGAQFAEMLGDRVALVIDDGPVRYPAGPTVIGLADDRWTVQREGVVSAAMIERQTACVVVFVCTGNTCRSPLAESLCKKRLSERLGCSAEELPRRGYVVTSAGLAAYPGCPAAPEAVAVAAAQGADLAAHRSRAMTAELLFQADHVVAMTRDHVEALEEAAAGLTAPPRLLSPDGEDVPDPVGRERVVYEECAAAIWKHLDALTAEILAR